MSLAPAFDRITDNALVTEVTDAPATRLTPYRINPGDTFVGRLDRVGDEDFVAVRLVAGQSYTISLEGSGASPVYDPYLGIYGANGTWLGGNDDGGDGYNSLLTFTAATTGTYYISAGSYDSDYTGRYSLSVSRGVTPIVFSPAQISDQLVNGYWESTGRSARSFDVGQGDTLNVDISALTAAGQRLATVALETWSSVTGIRFDMTPDAGAPIHITFSDRYADAYSTSSLSGPTILDSFVNVSTDWLASYGVGLNSYSLQTYIHEIGHALGLGHAGNYNGNAVYGVDNHYANDSWQATVMSYFDQLDNTFINADYAFVVTPMIADILAMQTIYGVTRNIRGGDTVYGDNSNAGGIYGRISTMPGDEVAWTIFDQGGRDVLDLRSATAAQQIDLRPGTVSNVYGAVGNLSIAFGTVIEVAFGGRGADRIIGNDAANGFMGGAGADVFVFASRLGGGNVDRIVDFNVTDDTIRLDDSIFSVLADGRLAANAFAANAAGRAVDASDRIIYETDTGALLYDRDGAGGAAAVRFAVVSAGLHLTNADFLVA